MESERPSTEFDALLANAGWVRGLARKLASNPDEAEDLSQETWLRALRSPPRHAVHLKAWLAEVLRSAAHTRRRSDRRRWQREQRQAAPAVGETPAELVARAELHRRLVDTVLELPEPYRATILGRYFEGKSAQQLARNLGLSDATVRSRQKRGLEMLRARLEAGWGGGWRSECLALAGIGGGPGVAAGSLTSFSIGSWIAMLSHSSKAVGAVLALVLVSTAVFLWWDAGAAIEPAAGPSPRPAPAAELEANGSVTAANGADAGETARSAVAAGASSLGTVLVRVADLQGMPLPDAEVTAFSVRAAELILNGASLERALEPPEGTPVVTARGDAAGRVELEGLPSGRPAVQLRAAHPGHAWRVVRREVEATGGAPIDLGEVALAPGNEILVRVRRAGGAPVAGAKISLQTPVANPPGTLNFRSGRSDTRGELRIPGALAALHAIEVIAEGYLPVQGELELPPGTAFLHEVELDPGLEITGIVLDPDGSPAPGVHVWAQPDPGYPGWWPDFFSDFREQWRATTAADGSFRIGGLEAKQRHRLLAERGRAWVASEMRDPGPGVVLRLPPLHRVRGRLAFPGGEPAAGARVGFNDVAWPDRGHRLARHAAIAGEDGGFETELPPGRFGMAAFHPRGEHDFDQTIAVTGDTDLGTLELPRGCALEVLVVDAETREPITGFLGADFDDDRAAPWTLDENTWRHGLHEYARLSWDPATPDFVCPGDGTMRLDQLPPGKLRFWIYAPGYFRTPCDVTLVREQATRITVGLERPAEVRILLLDGAGKPAPGRGLLLVPTVKGEVHVLPHGTTDESGVARMDEARAGIFRVQLEDSERLVLDEVEIHPGKNELTVRLPALLPLTILVEDAQGPVAGAEVRVRRRDLGAQPNSSIYTYEAVPGQTGADGTCVFEDQQTGEFLIHAWKVPGFPAWQVAAFERSGQVIRVQLGTGSVAGTVLDAPPGTEVLLLEASRFSMEEEYLPSILERSVEEGFDRLEPDSSSFATAKVGCDEEGRFRFATVPDGRYFLTATAPGYLPAKWQEFRIQGSSVQGASLRLEPAGRLVFRIVDAERKLRDAGAVQAHVRLRPVGGQQVIRSTWRVEETTTFEKLPPGSYLLQVAVQRERKYEVILELPATVEAGKTCELSWPG